MKNIILKLLKEYSIEKKLNNVKDGEIIATLLESEDTDYIDILKKEHFKISFFWKNNLKKFEKIKVKSLYLAEEIFSLNYKYNEEKLERLNQELEIVNKIVARATIYYLIKKLSIDNFHILFQNISNENSKYFLQDFLILIKEKYSPISLEEKLKKLEKYIKELRNSLEIVTFEKEKLEEERVLEKENLKYEIEKDFFMSLNSSENNYFIDNFKLSQLKLKKLNNENYEIPQELDSIIITLKSFSRFLKQNQIKEIVNIGDIIEIDFHRSFEYTYYGSEFLDENIKKIVKVETSGWKYGETVISKPIVREVI